MEIKSFRLNNLGRFKELEADLAPADQVLSNITVFIGNNGAGKTSILKALATSLSWFVARVRSEKGSGSPIPEEVILNKNTSAAIFVTLSDGEDSSDLPEVDADDQFFKWTLAKTSKGKKAQFNSELSAASRLADRYRTHLTTDENASLPLIAFYPVERVVVDIPLRI